ncbi:MAG: ATP-binding cassette domain-containing protein [Chloroflexi bacterium]|nr:ATP-binding cassette domain-containing protein [Chloroflexota bacterium]
MNPHFPYGHRPHTEALPGAPALEARAVTAGYPGAARPALSGVEVRVPVGARMALVGPNGAGKSTLLKAAAGLLPIHSGQILIFGQPVPACHHRLAYLPQRGEVDWRFPVDLRRLVLTGRYVHLGWLRRPGPADHRITDEVLERLGLSALARRQIGQLSGGQQQRALLARALAQDADLLLLDEPLNAVDAETRTVIAGVLDDLRARGKTVVMATHDLGRLESDFDGALYLCEGCETPPPPGAFVGLPLGTSGRPAPNGGRPAPESARP